MFRKLLGFFLFVSLLFPPQKIALAQENQDLPVYIIQSGDTLSSIALRFGISTQNLINANSISDPNSIVIGTKLSIPGLEGIKGVLISEVIPFGATLHSFSINHQISLDDLYRLNRITSPSEFFAGNSLVIPDISSSSGQYSSQIPFTANSTLELAVIDNLNPWTIPIENRIIDKWDILPSEGLSMKSKNINGEGQSDPLEGYEISVDPLPLSQGGLCKVIIRSSRPVDLSGSLIETQMKFHPLSANEQVAFIGLPLNSEPGITRMVITGYFPDMTGFSLDQPLLIGRSGYAEDPPLMVDPITIDPTTIEQEDALIFEITSKVTSDRLWNEKFSYPIDDPCIRAQFGNRRVYNFAYDSFHTGVDFGVCAQNLNIYAASPGVVVFTGPLVIRGNATIIDHGWGVYSGYWHQSGINVALGDRVDAGQIIGTIGTTGRSTGPHLHWEIRINGIPINPIDWIEKSSP